MDNNESEKRDNTTKSDRQKDANNQIAKGPEICPYSPPGERISSRLYLTKGEDNTKEEISHSTKFKKETEFHTNDLDWDKRNRGPEIVTGPSSLDIVRAEDYLEDGDITEKPGSKHNSTQDTDNFPTIAVIAEPVFEEDDRNERAEVVMIGARPFHRSKLFWLLFGTCVLLALIVAIVVPMSKLRKLKKKKDPIENTTSLVLPSSQPSSQSSSDNPSLGPSSEQQWIQMGEDINCESSCDESGTFVSLSADGKTVAVASPFNDIKGVNTGLVRVYSFKSSSWEKIGQDLDGEAAGDKFGRSVSISDDGTILAIGAAFNDGNKADSGHVRVYTFVQNSWVPLGADIDGEAKGEGSGYSVSLSADGTVVAIGSSYNDGNKYRSGQARVYSFKSNSWQKIGQDIDGEVMGDGSYTVSLSANGTIVAIGAPRNEWNGVNSGHVRVYSFNGTLWKQIGQDIDGEAMEDQSGNGKSNALSLSSDGTIVAIGAQFNDGNGLNSGHVRVYSFGKDIWSRLGDDIDGVAAGDEFGFSVSLSSDGTKVAVGAPQNDGNGTNSGQARVYSFENNSWVQIGEDIDGDKESDSFGGSVSLSDDGKVLAVGAFYKENGLKSGPVKIYSLG